MPFASSGLEGCKVRASDAGIGAVRDFLFDDQNWKIRYLIIATRNWWPAKIVQLSPYAAKAID